MTLQSSYARAKSFAAKHWRGAVSAIAALAVFLLITLRLRRPSPDDTPTVPSGPARADRLHEQGTRERQDALEDRSLQEQAAARTAELEAADKLRAEEERMRAERIEASSDISAANRYADRVSGRKAGPP